MVEPVRTRPRLLREISDLYLQLAVGGLLHSLLRAALDAAAIWAALAALALAGTAVGEGGCAGACLLRNEARGCCVDGTMLVLSVLAGLVLLLGGMLGTYLVARRKLQHSVMATVFTILPLALFPLDHFTLPVGKGWCALLIFSLMYVGYRLSFPFRAAIRSRR